MRPFIRKIVAVYTVQAAFVAHRLQKRGPLAFPVLLLTLLVPSLASAQLPTDTASARPSPAPASPLSGRSFRDCADCPEMVVIPAGTFTFGSPEGEPDRAPVEGPQRRITIPALSVGKFHVTRGQWAAFVAATNRPTRGGCSWASATRQEPDPHASWRALDFEQDDSHPVVCVTWADAQDYARWLSQRTGHKYRLLSETEWEYAARAGTDTPYPWGTSASHERANYGEEACCTGLALGRDRWVKSSPVGAFPPNAFGLHDMHGNVMQWVQDCFSDYADVATDGSAYETSSPVKDAGRWTRGIVGTNACAYRMLRGGDWGNPPRMIRSASRNYAPAPGSTIDNYRSGGLGFRVARALD